MSSPEQSIESKTPRSPIEQSPSKWQFVGRALWRTGLSAVMAAGFYLKNAGHIDAQSINSIPQKRSNHELVDTAHPFWPPKLVQEWIPIYDEAAAANHGWPGQPQLEQMQDTDPNRKLGLYDQIERAKGIGPGNALNSALYIINYAITENNRMVDEGKKTHKQILSAGFCHEGAKLRAVWGPPPMGTRIYEVNGTQFVIDDGTTAVLAAAAGTRVASINSESVFDEAGNRLQQRIYDKLRQWVENPNRKPFVVDAPGVNQSGSWWRVVSAADESSFYGDDFNLAPHFFSTSLIKEIAEPYPLIPGVSIPDDIKPQVDAWLADNAGGMVDVNLHLIYDIIYNSKPINVYAAQLIGTDKDGNKRVFTNSKGLEIMSYVVWHPTLVDRKTAKNNHLAKAAQSNFPE